MHWDKFAIPIMVALLAGLFSAVIWPTHERARQNRVDLLEFKKETYFNKLSHLKSHREEARQMSRITEQWCSEHECSPAEEMSMRKRRGDLDMWEKRVENFVEENKHMGK